MGALLGRLVLERSGSLTPGRGRTIGVVGEIWEWRCMLGHNLQPFTMNWPGFGLVLRVKSALFKPRVTEWLGT